MKRIVLVLSTIFLAAILVACGKDEEETLKAPPKLEVLEVELSVPEKVKVSESVDMSTVVTYGDRKVDDADEVVYEVWEEGKKNESEMIESENEGDGVYTASTSFDHDGLFHIQVHVTAEAQHNMPVEEVTAGEGGDYEKEESQFHTEGFMMHFMKPSAPKKDEEQALMVHLELMDDALTDANVRFEIWHIDDEDAHEWADAKEDAKGEYIANYTFKNSGQYKVVIHVEDDDDLHEHEEHTINVE